MSSSLDILRNRIRALRQRSSDHRYYVDRHSLGTLCTPRVIEEAVRDCPFPPHERNHIRDRIIANGTVTFCVLVYIRKESFMTNFLERDVYNALDYRLPLDEESLDGIAKEAASEFFEAQWRFLPVILRRYRHMQIEDECILPFDSDEHDEDRDGSFGAIHTVIIPSSMQELVDTQEPTVKVIRKQLRLRSNTADFERERRCLEVLQGLKHPNIVDLLCSYTYRKEHSLVFKCEDMNLNEFLGLTKRYGDFASNTVFYTALYGLASAIEYLHGGDIGGEDENKTIIGYHHDIRPHNILVRRDSFVLADFGLAKMEESDSSSSSYKGGGGDYIAPERLVRGARIRCAADIWSFGGVIVDIASYIEGGPEARGAAQDRRESIGPYAGVTTCYFFLDDMVKPAVMETIKSLQQDPSDKTIRTLLLLSEAMLKVEPDARPDAKVVYENMAYIALKSLFRAALKAMIKWKMQAQESGPGRIWEDTWKLWAWGEEVGINGARLMPDTALRRDKTSKKLEKILVDLVKLVTTQVREKQSGIQKLSRRGTDSSITYTTESQKINECIRDLRHALPEGYRIRIEQRKGYYGPFATTEPPRLPTLSDEPFIEQSSNAERSTGSKEPTPVSDRKPSSQHGDDQDMISQVLPNSPSCLYQMELPLKYQSRSESEDPSLRHETGVDPSKSKEKASFTSTPASSYIEARYSSAPSSAAQTTTTTPITLGDTNKALPPIPLLPGAALDVNTFPPERGQLVRAAKLSADLSFIDENQRWKERCDIHVEEAQVSGKIQKTIQCTGKVSGIKLRHEVCRFTPAYPHTDHPNGALGKERSVSFLGPQVLYGQTQSPPGERLINTVDVYYTFADPEECKLFRQEIWDKKLLICAGAIQISWEPLKKADYLSISLWKEWTGPSAFSIVFRAMKKGKTEHELIELRLARPKAYEKQKHQYLHLNLDPTSVASQGAAPKTKHQKLKIEFDDKNQCTAFRKQLDRFSIEPPSAN